MSRKRGRVEPSDELVTVLETATLGFLEQRGGREFWTHISTHINGSFINPTIPVQREWIKLSSYGRMKVLGAVMRDLEARDVVRRKKNFHPYILVGILDRIAKAVDDAYGNNV